MGGLCDSDSDGPVSGCTSARCLDMGTREKTQKVAWSLANLWMTTYKQGGRSVRTRSHNY